MAALWVAQQPLGMVFPQSFYWAIAIVAFFVACYRAWESEYSARERLEEFVLGFPRLCFSPKGAFLQSFDVLLWGPGREGNLIPMGVSATLQGLYLSVVNDPVTTGEQSIAKSVTAAIEFYEPQGDLLLAMDGRWSESPQPANRDRSKDFVADILPADFNIGATRNLDIACKAQNEEYCFALNNDSFAKGHDPRLARHRLPTGHLIARVRLRAVNVDCVFEVIFRNPGQGGSLQVIEQSQKNNIQMPKQIQQ